MLLQIDIVGVSWRSVRGIKARLNKAMAVAEEFLPAGLQAQARRATIGVRLTSNKEIKELNKIWRGKNKPTNVLSFPHFTKAELLKLKKQKGPFYAGDIAVAYGVTRDEAKAEDKRVLDHLTHLVIHGVLHIFGYDHITDAEAVQMEKKEIAWMKKLSLPNPYEIKKSKRTKK